MSQIPLINNAAFVLKLVEPSAPVQGATPPSAQKPFKQSFAEVQAESNARPQRADSQLSDRPDAAPASVEQQEKRIDVQRDDQTRPIAPDHEIQSRDQDEEPLVIDAAAAPEADTSDPEVNEKQTQGEVAKPIDDGAEVAGSADEVTTGEVVPQVLGVDLRSAALSAQSKLATAETDTPQQGSSSTATGSAKESVQLDVPVDVTSQELNVSTDGRAAEVVSSTTQRTTVAETKQFTGVVDADPEAEVEVEAEAKEPELDQVRTERVVTQPLQQNSDTQATKQEPVSNRLSSTNVPQAAPASSAEGRQSGEGLGDRSDSHRQEGLSRAVESVESAPKQTNTEAIFQIDRLADAGGAKADYTSLLKTGNEVSQSARQLASAAHGVDGRLVSQSVSRGLAAAMQNNQGEVVLRLSPATLGVVRIKMTLDHGMVSVRLEATTQAAQQAMSDNLSALRSSLESRGLTVERVSVHHTPAPSGQGANSSSQQGGSNQSESGEHSSKHDAGDAPSNGRRDDGAGSGVYDPDGVLDAEEMGESSTFDQQFHVRLEALA